MSTTTRSSTQALAETDAGVGKGPALLGPLRVRDFRLVFTGESISLIGDQFHFVALAWLTLQRTESASGLVSGIPQQMRDEAAS